MKRFNKAMPIPRTLVLTYFGDMDVSELREKPAGRQPIDTRTVSMARLEETVDAVGRALEVGKRVYWVCPLVEQSQDIPLADAEQRHAFLRQRFGDVVGLVHGRMRGAEKDRKNSERDFRTGKIDDAALVVNTKRYEDAIVNYYLGLRAYRDRLAALPRK